MLIANSTAPCMNFCRNSSTDAAEMFFNAVAVVLIVVESAGSVVACKNVEYMFLYVIEIDILQRLDTKGDYYSLLM